MNELLYEIAQDVISRTGVTAYVVTYHDGVKVCGTFNAHAAARIAERIAATARRYLRDFGVTSITTEAARGEARIMIEG